MTRSFQLQDENDVVARVEEQAKSHSIVDKSEQNPRLSFVRAYVADSALRISEDCKKNKRGTQHTKEIQPKVYEVLNTDLDSTDPNTLNIMNQLFNNLDA